MNFATIIARLAAGLFATCGAVHVLAEATTSVATEYVATLYAPLDAPQIIDNGLLIYNVAPGGSIDGPKIKGKPIQPCGDWGRVLPSGVFELDVRCTIKTDDGALIYIYYYGAAVADQKIMERFGKGETLTAKDFYFITAPRMRTSAEKYKWVNEAQFVGKMIGVKDNNGGFVKYDLFLAR